METNNMFGLPEWAGKSLAGLLIAFLALTVVDKVYDVSENFKSTIPKNTISMSAEGKVAAKPDIATINVGVLTTSSTAKAAQEANTKSSNKIIDFVKQQGIPDEDITTSNFSVYPNYNYESGKNVIDGYQANQTLTIKVRGVDKSTAVLSTILGGAVDSGSNQIQGVNFGFNDSDELLQQARKLAIEKAKQKAADLAEASGLRLGKVVSISENSIYQPYPMPYALDAAKNEAMGGAAPQIETGSQDITAQMTVVFEVK